MHLYIGSPSYKRDLDYILKFNEDKEFEYQIGLMGTFDSPKKVIKWLGDGFTKIFLDSGAYTVFKSGKQINIDNYADFLLTWGDKLTHYINLDVIADKIGYESLANWEYLKSKGLNPVPVYHAGEEWHILELYCQETDFVCLGGMAGVSANWKSWLPFLYRVFQQFPNHKFHALGVNDTKLALRFPWYSCDSVSWKVGEMFGEVITPWGRWKIGRDTSIGDNNISAFEIDKWLRENGFEYPFPEGFKFSTLNISNLQNLYNIVVLRERFEDLSEPEYLF